MSALADLQRALALFDTERTVAPLRYWRAWHNPNGTSQLRALQAFAQEKTLGVFGGNRSGKTELGRVVLVALVLGSDHPDVRFFWEAHDVDPDLFPRGPDDGMIIAVTSGDSIRYHRRQILSLLPKWGPRHPMALRTTSNVRSWNLYGRGEAHVECMVPGYATPARIYFKMEDQGEDAFQGDAVRAIHHDEEGKTGKIWSSCQYRLIDKDGWQFLTNTPIYGKTWTYNTFERKEHGDVRLIRIHSEDNPYLPRNRVGKYAKDAVRGRGEYADKAGKVWWSFREEVHVVKPFHIPAEWQRWRGIDLGTRHPFTCLWGTKLKSSVRLPNNRVLRDGTVVVYRQHYRAEQTTPWHVARMKELEGYVRENGEDEDPLRPHEGWVATDDTERIHASWCDSEDPQQIMQMNTLYGMGISRARKAVKTGIDLVSDYLTPDEAGEPRLVFFDTCTDAIREVGGYHWTKVRTADGAEKMVPAQVDDHSCDALRYLLMGIVYSSM